MVGKAPARLRLSAVRVDEDTLHEQVAGALDVLLLPPAMWTTFPAGGYLLTPAAAARLYRLGLKPSWPDILLLHGAIFGIELKAEDGKLSKTRIIRSRRGGLRYVQGQEETHPKLIRAGMQIAVCRSLEAVLVQVAAWGIPLRGRIAV